MTTAKNYTLKCNCLAIAVRLFYHNKQKCSIIATKKLQKSYKEELRV